MNAFSISPDEVAIKFLNSNYRSHIKIVNYYDNYINSFNSMRLKGARVEGKPSLNSKSPISGDYPAVAYITGKTIPETAESFALFVDDLLRNNIIQKPNQCALLMRSVRESSYYAGPFAEALRNIGIKTYNPRSKSYLEQKEIMGALGAFVSIIDPNLTALDAIGPEHIKDTVQNWVDEYKLIIRTNTPLSEYVSKSVESISILSTNKWIGANILDIFYHILAHEPFNKWRDDVEKTYRLGQLSKIFETYASVPYSGFPGSERGNLRTSSTEDGSISFNWRKTFYYALIGLLVSSGLDDPEHEIQTPPDRLPIMTVHQAKGLEFPFVFVYGLNQKVRSDVSILLEDAFSDFRKKPPLVEFTPKERAEQDMIRFYYVAYSRAMYALIHIIPKAHFKNGNIGFIGKKVQEFQEKADEVRV